MHHVESSFSITEMDIKPIILNLNNFWQYIETKCQVDRLILFIFDNVLNLFGRKHKKYRLNLKD